MRRRRRSSRRIMVRRRMALSLKSFFTTDDSSVVGDTATATAVGRPAALLEGGHGFLVGASVLGGVGLALRNPFF
jgi:hypothetical protein